MAEDATGTWNMETSSQFQFNLAFIQSDSSITGTMARSANGAPVDAEPVDPITGTVDPSGAIRFTRERPGAFTQVYTGQISGSGDARSIQGNFTHNSDPGGAWTASFVPMRFLFPDARVAGPMEADNNQFQFELTLTPTFDVITGTMKRTNGTEPEDIVFGSMPTNNGKVEFSRVRPSEFVQHYTGLYINQALDGGLDPHISMQGTFTRDGAQSSPNSGWFAKLSLTGIHPV